VKVSRATFAVLGAIHENLSDLGGFSGSQACAPRAWPSAPCAGYASQQCNINTVVRLPVCHAP